MILPHYPNPIPTLHSLHPTATTPRIPKPYLQYPIHQKIIKLINFQPQNQTQTSASSALHSAMSSSAIAFKSFTGLRPSSSADPTKLRSQPLPISLNRRRILRISASKTSPKLQNRNLRVAVIGGGPAGGSAAETLAKGGVETFLIERKLDNCKPCGGAIPLCMVGEFDLPLDIIDRRVTKMKMISPSNIAVDIGQTLKPHEYIGMVRREVLDAYLRERAAENGAKVINGLFLKMDVPEGGETAPYVLHYTEYDGRKGGVGVKKKMEVDAVIGADGANSRVAKCINAGDYEYAIAFQV